MTDVIERNQSGTPVVASADTMGTISVPAAQQQLARALLRAMYERGEIGPYLYNAREEIDHESNRLMWRASYARIRYPRSRVPLRIAAVVAVGAAVGGVCWLVYASRYVIVTAAALALLAVWAGAKTLAGHKLLCPGLHCAGCTG